VDANHPPNAETIARRTEIIAPKLVLQRHRNFAAEARLLKVQRFFAAPVKEEIRLALH
jgi:hypothetical protein